MEINSLKPREQVVEIKHPKTKEELGIKISLVSLMDPKAKSLKRQFAIAKMERDRRGKDMTYDELEDNSMQLLLKVIVGWDWGDNTFNGEKPEFNEKNVKAVLTELEWLKLQLLEKLEDESSFFPD